MNWHTCILPLFLASATASLAAAAGDVVFQTDFETRETLQTWQAGQNKHVRIEPGFQSARSLCFTAPAGVTSNNTLRLALPVELMRGARLRCEARVKAEGVTPAPHHWNGIKFMLHVVHPAGSTWPQPSLPQGTFDWQKAQFTVRVPKDATSASLVLGLESVHGTAAFDDIKITVVNPPRPAITTRPTTPPFRGHELPRLRGAMLGRVKADDLREFGEQWGANHVRWQLIWGGFPQSPADKGDLAAYDTWLGGELNRLDELLPVCEKAGLKVLIDIHTPPGGRNKASECRMFHEPRFQDNFLAWWDKISRRYVGNKTVWGYDLVNEPVEGTVADGCMDWQQLATAAARVVRKNDPEHAIVVEPAPWGGPESIENLEPLPVPGVVYSVHMYQPHKFTHQGVYENAVGLNYPGEVEGKSWNKDRLRKALQPVADFQRDFGVHIYIGEFSAIRWAPDDSAYRYLKDCIEIFEEQGWDWAYHAFREWDGWSVEHGSVKSDRSRSQTPTNRERLLQQWFAKNRK